MRKTIYGITDKYRIETQAGADHWVHDIHDLLMLSTEKLSAEEFLFHV